MHKLLIHINHQHTFISTPDLPPHGGKMCLGQSSTKNLSPGALKPLGGFSHYFNLIFQEYNKRT